MKIAPFISAIVLASGMPLMAHAWGMGGEAAAGMHTATIMTNFATGIASSAINAGTGNMTRGAGNMSGGVSGSAGNMSGSTSSGMMGGNGDANNTGIATQSTTIPGLVEITLPNITLPASFGLSLPEINIPEIKFPTITIPKNVNNAQPSGSNNSVNQVNDNNTIIQQQSNVPGTSTVMIRNQSINTNNQTTIP